MPKRPRTTTFGTSKTPTKNPDNGYFAKGQWLCNCQPRLPAVQFQVHRESANKGRWFYTCQHDRTKGKTGDPARCNFFLWAEDARLREEGAVLGNSTTEPGGSTQAAATNDGENKKSLRTPRKLVQTTLSARVEPREEGKRHWTHRTEITPINDLERAVNCSQKEINIPEHGRNEDEEENESTQRRITDKGKAKELPLDTARSSSTLKASNDSKTATGASAPGNPADRNDEDELGHVADSAMKSDPTTKAAPREQMQTAPAGSKRKRDAADSSDDDDDLFGDMDSEEERQLVAITDSSKPPSRTRDAFITPAAQRTTDVMAGMPTPSLTGKSVRRVLFSDPVDDSSTSNSKRQRNDETGAFTVVGGPSTPSSSQEGAGPSSSPATPGSGSGIANITEEIMDLLKDQKIESQIQQKVKSALQTFAAKAKGLEKGRDASRQALKARDSKIAHLQMQIVDLENKRKLDYEARKEMRNQMMQLYTKF